MYKGFKICLGIFVILLAVVHACFNFGCEVIFGLMEGWILHSTNAEIVWLDGGFLISIFLFVSGILVFYEKWKYALAACVTDFIYWLVPCIAFVVPINSLHGLVSFFRGGVCFLCAFCIADVIGIASIIFLSVMKNKQKPSAVLSDNQEEGK